MMWDVWVWAPLGVHFTPRFQIVALLKELKSNSHAQQPTSQPPFSLLPRRAAIF